MGRKGKVRQSRQCEVRSGEVMRGDVRRVMARQSWIGEAGPVPVCRGKVVQVSLWYGSCGTARHFEDVSGEACSGSHGLVVRVPLW